MQYLIAFLAAFTACAAPNRLGATDSWSTYQLVGPIVDDEPPVIAAWLDGARRAGLKRVYMLVDSPGGHAVAGLNIANAIRKSPIPVTCIVRNRAASAAFTVFVNCERRVAKQSATLMIHRPGAQLAGQFSSQELAMAIREIEAIAALYEMVTAPRLEPKTALATYRAKVAAGDWKMTADEAFAAGAVDEVVQ